MSCWDMVRNSESNKKQLVTGLSLCCGFYYVMIHADYFDLIVLLEEKSAFYELTKRAVYYFSEDEDATKNCKT